MAFFPSFPEAVTTVIPLEIMLETASSRASFAGPPRLKFAIIGYSRSFLADLSARQKSMPSFFSEMNIFSQTCNHGGCHSISFSIQNFYHPYLIRRLGVCDKARPTWSSGAHSHGWFSGSRQRHHGSTVAVGIYAAFPAVFSLVCIETPLYEEAIITNVDAGIENQYATHIVIHSQPGHAPIRSGRLYVPTFGCGATTFEYGSILDYVQYL